MAGVTGLGGAFVRAILRLSIWYEKHLGISSPHGSFCLPTKRSVPTLQLPSSRVLRTISLSRSLRCSTSRWMT